MGYLTLFLTLFVYVLLVVPFARSTQCELEAKLKLLSDKIEHLERKDIALGEKNMELELRNSQLEKKVSHMEHEHHSRPKANESSPTSYNIFDCYLTENWGTDGIIKFNGCSGMICLHIKGYKSSHYKNQT